MIRLLITPETNELNIAIPDDYVGKKVGVLVFALDEVSEPPVRKNVMAQFWNVISDKSTAEMHKHIEQSRSEWERDI